MIWLKQCKKCRGDLAMESDKFGTYVSCIQCGAVAADVDARHKPAGVVEALATAGLQVPAVGRRAV